jgi:hypothetical protein
MRAETQPFTPSRKFPSLFPRIDSSVAHALALSGFPVYVAQFPLAPFIELNNLIEKRTHFPQHLIEFRRLHLSNRVNNDAVFNCEKSLRTNEAWLGELSALKIATIQRNRKSIGSRAARDLTENQILAWKIDNY